MEQNQAVTLVYTNYKGESGVRKVVPKSIYFGHNEWHKEDQWLMLAFDLKKQADRTFALKDVRAWFDGELE